MTLSPRQENDSIRFVGMFFACLLMLQWTSVLHADDALNEQQKEEKRQELNQAVRVAENLKQEKRKENYQLNPWTVNVASNFGYDRNVTFDSRRIGDTYHQESVAATYKADHGDLAGMIPAGRIGVSGTVDELDYSKQNQSDYRNFKVNPFSIVNLTRYESLRTEYTFKNIRYLKNDQVNYLSHEIKNSLVEARLAHWLHTVYVIVDFRDYTDRFALDQTGASSDSKRLDLFNEYGYSAVYFPSDKLVFGVTGAYKANDSNDNFKDYSDYTGYKVTGFAYAVLSDRISWVGAAGWDEKWYKSKTLNVDPSQKENDGFLYFATYLYYNLTPKTQIVLSYLWDQDFSNEPLLQFNGSMVTAGFSVKI